MVQLKELGKRVIEASNAHLFKQEWDDPNKPNFKAIFMVETGVNITALARVKKQVPQLPGEEENGYIKGQIVNGTFSPNQIVYLLEYLPLRLMQTFRTIPTQERAQPPGNYPKIYETDIKRRAKRVAKLDTEAALIAKAQPAVDNWGYMTDAWVR